MKSIKIVITITEDSITLDGNNFNELTTNDVIDSIKMIGMLGEIMSTSRKETAMEMRKFIIEMHPDGTLSCCEYEDPSVVAREDKYRAWLSGYRQALVHCNEQVKALEGIKGNSVAAGLMYEGATHVRDGAEKMYRKYAQIFK